VIGYIGDYMREKNQRSTSGHYYSNEIWVNEFTEKSAAMFREHVLYLSEKDPDKPLIVFIDSYGGYIDSLAKMIETMNEVPNKFITACKGKAMSCGAILLSNGDVRYCGELSRVLIHHVAGYAEGDVYDQAASANETMRLDNMFMSLLAKNCNKTYSEIYDAIRTSVNGKDIVMNAEEAKKFGIIDEIGTPVLKTTLTWQCMTIRTEYVKEEIAPAKAIKKKKKVKKKKA
jgi:ATP-dependent Clp protease protease subunit